MFKTFSLFGLPGVKKNAKLKKKVIQKAKKKFKYINVKKCLIAVCPKNDKKCSSQCQYLAAQCRFVGRKKQSLKYFTQKNSRQFVCKIFETVHKKRKSIYCAQTKP